LLWNQQLDPLTFSLTSTGNWVIPDVKVVGFVSTDGVTLTGVVGVKEERFWYFDMDPITKLVRREYEVVSNKAWNLTLTAGEPFMEKE